MTRLEEIKCASKDYVNYLLDKQEYHNDDYTEDDIRQAFEKGAMFADKNPDLSLLWHDASEMPKEGERICVHFGEDDCSVHKHGGINEAKWSFWCEEFNALRWAYISDLLPKGGEK